MTESTSEYKKRIEEIKQSIENEPYMAKMREDIAEGISKTGIRQAIVEEQFQSVLDETTGKDVISGPEIIVARGGASTLGERLDESDAQLAQTKDEVLELIGNVADGTPLFADNVSGMTDTTRIYLNTTDGYLYAYDGTSFKSTGVVYLSNSIEEYMTVENEEWEVI